MTKRAKLTLTSQPEAEKEPVKKVEAVVIAPETDAADADHVVEAELISVDPIPIKYKTNPDTEKILKIAGYGALALGGAWLLKKRLLWMLLK